jgi:hypothetical protein
MTRHAALITLAAVLAGGGALELAATTPLRRGPRDMDVAPPMETTRSASAPAGSTAGRVPRAGTDTRWAIQVAAVDQALASHDISGAVRAWHDAYGAALASREWEPMVAVGDAFVRIGEAARARRGAAPNARQAYLVALLRTRRDGSADGALRVAAAFAALGDRAVAAQCTRVARRIAEDHHDALAMERVKRFTATERSDPS